MPLPLDSLNLKNMFSESQTLLDTTTYFKSSLYNFKVGLAVLSALQNWDGTVRALSFPVAVFSEHCVCAQLVKEELSRSAVLAATFELGMLKQLPIYWPIFHKDSTHHLCSGLLSCVSPFLGQAANTGWFGRASAALHPGAVRNSHLAGQSPSVQRKAASCLPMAAVQNTELWPRGFQLYKLLT